MKFFKNVKFVAGCALIALGSVLIALWVFRTPAHEINRAELEQMLQSQGLLHGHVSPTPYAGIYHVEGTRKSGAKQERVFITTHLDGAQIKKLCDQTRSEERRV